MTAAAPLPRLLVEDGGTRLWAPCPVTDDHLAIFDLASDLVVCPACPHLVLDRASYRQLVEHRLERTALTDRLAELEAAWDPRSRAARARAARIEELYVVGLRQAEEAA